MYNILYDDILSCIGYIREVSEEALTTQESKWDSLEEKQFMLDWDKERLDKTIEQLKADINEITTAKEN